ncbi:hypothetical protein RB195_012454 [Necator americanus]|uniref:Tetraspanin family protein n=1 Tax=Necator americanus TaxID=51031 RepID=A0ABR1D758_NECAM
MNSEQEAAQRDWLRIILNKEKCRKLKPESRLAIVHELISDCQKRGVERVLKRNRIRLIGWKYLSWITAVVRIICMMALLWILWDLRYIHFDFLVKFRRQHKSLIFKMVFQFLALAIFLTITGILMEFVLILSFQIQRSSIISFVYGLSMLVVVLLIGTAPFIAGFYAHSQHLIADLYLYIISENRAEYRDVVAFHVHYKCCGFGKKTDWFSRYLFRHKMLFTNEVHEHENNFFWIPLWTRYLRLSESCGVPPYCCKTNKPECYLVNVSKNSGFEFELMNDKPKKAYEHYKGIFREPPVDDLLDPCFPIIAEAVDLLLSGTYKWFIILALSTVVMTVLVAVVLLYNSGQGELFPHLNKVRSPHRNSLVWFFIKMDGEEQNFNDEDLTDFSIIQELKDFDIDKDFTDMD